MPWTWLDFEMDGDSISLLRYKIFCKFKDRLESMRNLRMAYSYVLMTRLEELLKQEMVTISCVCSYHHPVFVATHHPVCDALIHSKQLSGQLYM